MTNTNQTYKSIVLIIILVFGVATLYGIKTDEAPRFILALGRFHPMLLHLPIGALVVTFFIDVLGRIQKKYPETTIKNLLGITSVFAIVTCFFGYFLSLEGGYQKDTLDLHFYTGIATAILANLLFIISWKPNFKSNTLFLPLFIVTLITISVAGHFGSVLTHGDNFLTEYISASEEEETIEVIDSLKLYENVVAKILDQKCIQCHNTSKQKGELSLISKDVILKGGTSGLTVVKGNASESKLYSRLLLPISDEEHMPPEGKEQLTKDEIWLIKHWIDKGLDFENYATANSENDTLRRALSKYLVFNKVKISKASIEAIEEVKTAGFRVLELVPGQAALNVKCLDTTPTKEHMDGLSVLKEQITELDFGNAKLTDEMTSVFKQFKNLKSLRLNSPLITDKSLEHLKSLNHLEVLNIYNTNITNDGLSNLLKAVQPKRIYTWSTKVDQQTAQSLSREFDITIQNAMVSGFVENSQLEPPIITPDKTLFTDTIHVNATSPLKDVELRYTLNGDVPDSTSMPDERYPDPLKLFDLSEGSLDFRDGNWVGFSGNDLSVNIDLGSTQAVNHISVSCLEDIGEQSKNIDARKEKFTITLEDVKGRFFKVVIKNHNALPEWHPSAGNPSWLFVDEVYFW